MSFPDPSNEPNFYSQIPSDAADILSSVRDTVGHGFCLSGQDGIICDVNAQLAEWLGYEREAMISRHYTEFIVEKLRPYARMHLQEFFAEQHQSHKEAWDFEDRQGNVVVMEVTSTRVRLGNSWYKMDMILEVNKKPEVSKSEEIDKLQQENRHLFKNTLQEVTGLLQLQAALLEGEVKQLLLASQKRTEVISMAFDQLYKNQGSKEIDVGKYLQKLLQNHQIPKENMSKHPVLNMEISNCYALGLILNEIMMSLTAEKKNLRLSGSIEKGYYRVRLSSSVRMRHKVPKDFGQQLINALCRQLMAKKVKSEDERILLDLEIPL